MSWALLENLKGDSWDAQSKTDEKSHRDVIWFQFPHLSIAVFMMNTYCRQSPIISPERERMANVANV